MNLNDFFVNDYIETFIPGLTKETIVEYLETNFLSQMFGSWKFVEMDEMFGVEDSDHIVDWHNDSKWGMNVTFLYYMSDMSPEVGGSISIRTPDIEKVIYPKNGTLIMMSQHDHVEHRAEFATIERHMFNIDFYVDGY